MTETKFGIQKTEEEWREVLTKEQYHVTREAGTERPFTGAYWDYQEIGIYSCVCCHRDLFRSDMKYDAGCGWPSFFEEYEGAGIVRRPDLSAGRVRTEILCGACGAHLGHVFPDGPPPTHERYCVNSISLEFRKEH